MKREIVFRGKRTDNGAWAYGSLFVGITSESGKYYRIADLNGSLYPVSSETVGQFTGIHDANDKMIFEGDIVIVTSKEDGNSVVREVGFDNGCFSFFGELNFDMSQPMGSYEVRFGRYLPLFYTVEVVGNREDNPERLSEIYTKRTGGQ